MKLNLNDDKAAQKLRNASAAVGFGVKVYRLLPPKGRKVVIIGGIGYAAVASLVVAYRTNTAFQSRVDHAAAKGAVWAIRIAMAAKAPFESWIMSAQEITPEEFLQHWKGAEDTDTAGEVDEDTKEKAEA